MRGRGAERPFVPLVLHFKWYGHGRRSVTSHPRVRGAGLLRQGTVEATDPDAAVRHAAGIFETQCLLDVAAVAAAAEDKAAASSAKGTLATQLTVPACLQTGAYQRKATGGTVVEAAKEISLHNGAPAGGTGATRKGRGLNKRKQEKRKQEM